MSSLTFADEQTQWQRNPSSTTEGTLTLEMRDFGAYWGIDVGFVRPAIVLGGDNTRRPIALQVNGIGVMTVATFAEAQVWFNGFALAYTAAMHNVQTKIDAALAR